MATEPKAGDLLMHGAKAIGRWFDADVRIRDTLFGEERVYQTTEVDWLEHDSTPAGWSPYIWAEGNYSCDCNRRLFFERAAGNDPDPRSGACTDGRFVVLSITRRETGEVLYEETLTPG